MTPTPAHRHAVGITRREVIQAGYSGLLGLTLPGLFAGRASAAPAPEKRKKNKSLVIVFLTGAASHHDTFDMKPDAPAEIRGEFKPIASSVPGLQVCEQLPRLAARAHKYAVVRSLSHRDNNHLMSTHHVLTGHLMPGGFFDKVASRDDWPNYAGALSYLRPRNDGVPVGVNLPTFLMEGPLTWPGQHAGFLGPKHDPWQITSDPAKPDFRVDSLSLAPGLLAERLESRRALLDEINQQQRRMANVAECQRLTDHQAKAMSVLTSGRLSGAFSLDQEPAAVRERYGAHSFGQSLLLARRLVEAGVSVVQVNMGRVQNWDHHSNIFPTLKRMLPPLDTGVSALLDDLETRGLLDDTMVLMMGEFGRSPKINAAGRDHWGPCFFALFAGGGVRGGQVIGASDKTGAYPKTPPIAPDDVAATVYRVLGVDPASEVIDRQNRPVQLNRGSVIETLFSGAAG
jgi:Protein of unknown function (DUF1501)